MARNEAWEFALPESGAPCGPACHRREQGCREVCQDWAAFEQEKKRRYRERLEKMNINNYAAEAVRRNKKSHGRK